MQKDITWKHDLLQIKYLFIPETMSGISPDKASLDVKKRPGMPGAPDAGTDPSDTDERSRLSSSPDSGQPVGAPQGKRPVKKAQRTRRIELKPPFLGAGLSASAEKLNEDVGEFQTSNASTSQDLRGDALNSSLSASSAGTVDASHQPAAAIITTFTEASNAEIAQTATVEKDVKPREDLSEKAAPQQTGAQRQQETKPVKPVETVAETATHQQGAAKSQPVPKPVNPEGNLAEKATAQQASVKPQPGIKPDHNIKKPQENAKTVKFTEKPSDTNTNQNELKKRHQTTPKTKPKPDKNQDKVQATQRKLHQEMMSELKGLADKITDDDDDDDDLLDEDDMEQPRRSTFTNGLQSCTRAIFELVFEITKAMVLAAWHFVPVVLGLMIFCGMTYALQFHLRPLSHQECPGFDDRLQLIFRALVVSLLPVILGNACVRTLKIFNMAMLVTEISFQHFLKV